MAFGRLDAMENVELKKVVKSKMKINKTDVETTDDDESAVHFTNYHQFLWFFSVVAALD